MIRKTGRLRLSGPDAPTLRWATCPTETIAATLEDRDYHAAKNVPWLPPSS